MTAPFAVSPASLRSRLVIGKSWLAHGRGVQMIAKRVQDGQPEASTAVSSVLAGSATPSWLRGRGTALTRHYLLGLWRT